MEKIIIKKGESMHGKCKARGGQMHRNVHLLVCQDITDTIRERTGPTRFKALCPLI